MNTIFTERKKKGDKAKSRLDESLNLSSTQTQPNGTKTPFLFNEEESLA
jgi:hypothetical protein